MPVLVPWDCADGFFEAYWRRPEGYLDENVRRGTSVWTAVGPDAEQRAVHRLRVMSHPVVGPNGTAASSTSRRRSSAFACSSPERGTARYAAWLSQKFRSPAVLSQESFVSVRQFGA